MLNQYFNQSDCDHPLSDRIFHDKTGWYFATRESVNMGPFPSRRCAEKEVANYLRSMRNYIKRQANL